MAKKTNSDQKIFAIVPARGGSKRLPGKNIKLLAGKPMIEYTIEAAFKSGCFSKVMVTTEDDEIAGVSAACGAEIIKRPVKLATDAAETIGVVLHAIDVMEKQGLEFDAIAILQPTSPLRAAEDIKNAVNLFLANDCDGVISVCEFDVSPYWALRKEGVYAVPLFGWECVARGSNTLPKTYAENGVIYIFDSNGLKERRGFYTDKIIPYMMPRERSVDVDTELQFYQAWAIIEGNTTRNGNMPENNNEINNH